MLDLDGSLPLAPNCLTWLTLAHLIAFNVRFLETTRRCAGESGRRRRRVGREEAVFPRRVQILSLMLGNPWSDFSDRVSKVGT
jgi:hypothetical protein